MTELSDEQRQTITQHNTVGRCHKCNIVWYWHGGGRKGFRVKDMACPKCRGPLGRSTWFNRSAQWRQMPWDRPAKPENVTNLTEMAEFFPG